MQEKIKAYNSELDNIKLVVEKLVTKQNSSVFDKLCNMCDNLFIKVCDYDVRELTLDDVHGLTNVLKRLLDICITLTNYKEYLINVIKANIEDLENKEKASSQVGISEIEEVSPDELNRQQSNISKLQLNQFQKKDAA